MEKRGREGDRDSLKEMFEDFSNLENETTSRHRKHRVPKKMNP